MKKLIYTLLELEKEFRNRTCDFCSNRFGNSNKAVNEIITRNEVTDKLIAINMVCENCKERFENDELPKCGKCGRIQTKIDRDIFSGKYNCGCYEETQEKELPSLPQERESMTSFYERQINALREEKMVAENTIEEEREAHEDFMKVSEEWSKRQKQELLDKITQLEEENKKLKEQNQKIVPENLIKKIELYEKEIAELKERLEQANSQQQTAQIEVKTEKKFRFPFTKKT